MINAYPIMLILFVMTGLAVTGWGWRIIVVARKTLKWPNVSGTIDGSSPGSIAFSYIVKEQSYHHTVEIPIDITLNQPSVETPVNKYSLGKKVVVYYQPENPENATINPELDNDTWLIFVLGVGVTFSGLAFLFF